MIWKETRRKKGGMHGWDFTCVESWLERKMATVNDEMKWLRWNKDECHDGDKPPPPMLVTCVASLLRICTTHEPQRTTTTTIDDCMLT